MFAWTFHMRHNLSCCGFQLRKRSLACCSLAQVMVKCAMKEVIQILDDLKCMNQGMIMNVYDLGSPSICLVDTMLALSGVG